MTQSMPLEKVESRLGMTSNLALEHYSHSNIPGGSKKDITSDSKLIKSDFSAELRPIDHKLQSRVPINTPPINSALLATTSQQIRGGDQFITGAPLNITAQQPIHNRIDPYVPPIPPRYDNPRYDPQARYDRPPPPPAPPTKKGGFFSFGKKNELKGKMGLPPNLPNPQANMNVKSDDYKYYSTVKQVIGQNYPKGGFDKLLSCDAITMRPIFNLEEGASCTTNMNIFYIYPGEHSREQYSMEPLFVVRESTNTCAKYCLMTDCRPFEIVVSHDIEGVKEFLHMERACTANCLCVGRPEMIVDYTEEGMNQNFDMGGIFHPFVCCDYELEAFDNRGQTLFVITAKRCSCNIYCCFGCESCNKSVFEVKSLEGYLIGEINIGTHYTSCLPMSHECDYFSVDFPKFLGHTERILLMSAMIFISTRFFSKTVGSSQVILE